MEGNKMSKYKTALLTPRTLPNGEHDYVWETVLEETISTHTSKEEALQNVPVGYRTDHYNINSVN
jgi:hypothetical protein